MPVGGAPPGAKVARVDGPGRNDVDGDGIPDVLDIVLGAKKVVLNADRYENTYARLAYPWGDVPRGIGVCTDVIVRALRNAGIDLQQLVHEDILANPRAYPMVAKPDASLDHRRVRVLLPWFKRHWRLVPEGEPHVPGDVVFLDTLPRRGPDHVGIISDTLAPSGHPFVVNNWTEGYRTAEMDLLRFVPVTHRFRLERSAR